MFEGRGSIEWNCAYVVGGLLGCSMVGGWWRFPAADMGVVVMMMVVLLVFSFPLAFIRYEIYDCDVIFICCC